MDDEQITALIPAAYDAHVGVLWVKYQIAGHRLIPRNGGTVTVLCRCSSPVADDVLAACGVIEYPIDIPRAIHPVGPVGTGGGAAGGRDLHGGPPAGVPAEDQALAAPEVIDLAHQLAGGFYDLPALGAQIRRQRGKQFLGVGLRHGQIPNGPAQQVEVL